MAQTELARKSRKDMIAETRGKLIAAARRAFAREGYAEASMDDFTAEAGLTRGALYHHFGDKKGLLAAVIAEIDAEMAERLRGIFSAGSDPWQGFVDENVAYVEMALDPEIQRIMLRDGPAVLGDPASWPSADSCVKNITGRVEGLKRDGFIGDVDAEAVARLVIGASLYAAQWIAGSDDPRATSRKAIPAFVALMEGLRVGR